MWRLLQIHVRESLWRLHELHELHERNHVRGVYRVYGVYARDRPLRVCPALR